MNVTTQTYSENEENEQKSEVLVKNPWNTFQRGSCQRIERKKVNSWKLST